MTIHGSIGVILNFFLAAFSKAMNTAGKAPVVPALPTPLLPDSS